MEEGKVVTVQKKTGQRRRRHQSRQRCGGKEGGSKKEGSGEGPALSFTPVDKTHRFSAVGCISSVLMACELLKQNCHLTVPQEHSPRPALAERVGCVSIDVGVLQETMDVGVRWLCPGNADGTPA